ncbi:MAG: CBS domain-containing protein [Deltaproteobacteria bacterium]|nr:CBS domain-containing protein [Deltaproteobacteria bacterium]MBW2172180.1 CBS domain-containing protein [Deltaproteobacteria bacterium]
MVSAKDVMFPDVMTIREDTKTKDIIRLLVQHRITGLPVVSEDNRILGMVTEKDILKMLYERKPNVKSAADLMTSNISSFDENDNLMEVFKALVENNYRRVPILSEGKLAGIISRADIIRFISKQTVKQAQDEPED